MLSQITTSIRSTRLASCCLNRVLVYLAWTVTRGTLDDKGAEKFGPAAGIFFFFSGVISPDITRAIDQALPLLTSDVRLSLLWVPFSH